MSHNIKVLIYSLAGLFVLGGTILVLHLTAPNEIKPPTPPEPETPQWTDTSIEIYNTDIDTIMSIRIKNRLDLYDIVIKPDEAAKFLTVPQIDEENDSIGYNQTALMSVFHSAALLRARSVAEKDPQNLEQYGLVNPLALITITLTDDETRMFIIGNPAPTGNDMYFMHCKSENVYVVSAGNVSLFLNDRFHWVRRLAFPPYDMQTAPRIDSLSIIHSGSEEPILIESMPIDPLEELRTFNTHRLISPVNREIDQINSQPIMFGLFGLNAMAVEWVGIDERVLKDTGLDNPEMIVELKSGDETYTLTIGHFKNRDGKVGGYGLSSHVPDVLFLFDITDLPWLGLKIDSIVARLFLTPYIYSLDRVEIQTPDTQLITDIARAQNESNFSEFQNLYEYIISARGEEIFTGELEEASKLIARISYVYNDRLRPTDVVEFYTADNFRSIIRLNGENLFTTRDIYTTRLLANIAAYQSGDRIILEW